MFCTQCGASQDDNARFCTVCGAPLQQAQPTPVVVEEPAPVAEQPAPVVEQPAYTQPAQPVQPVYTQPVQPTYAQPQQKVPGKGFAIAGMVLGIVSLVTFWCYGFIAGILGIVFGGVAKSKGFKGGMATAGIVCGAIAICIWLVMFLIAGSAIAAFGSVL